MSQETKFASTASAFGLKAHQALKALEGRRPTTAIGPGDFPEGLAIMVFREPQVVSKHHCIRTASFEAFLVAGNVIRRAHPDLDELRL